MRKNKTAMAEAMNKKISVLIVENRGKVMTKANHGDVKAIWNAVKQSSRTGCILMFLTPMLMT